MTLAAPSPRPTPRPTRTTTLQRAMKQHTRAAYRQAILDSAEEVFIEHGVQAAKITEIAQRAGLSVGTLYNTFPSKEALFETLFERGRTEFFAYVGQPIASDSPRQKIRVVMRRTFQFVEEHGLSFARFLRYVRREDSPSKAGGPDESPQHVCSEASHARFLALIHELIEAGCQRGELRSDLDPRWLARSLVALAEGVLNDWLDDTSIPLSPQADTIATLFLEGASLRENA